MVSKNRLAVFAVAAAVALTSAYGERAATNTRQPVQSTAAQSQNELSVVLSFARPRITADAGGVSDVVIDGLDSAGAVGAPLLPVRPVRIAVPQGMAVAGVSVKPLSETLLADGVTVRHAERQYHYRPNAAYVPTPRDESIYSLGTRYPAAAADDGASASKNGVAFYETTVSPVFYTPKTGEVGYYPEVMVTLALAAKRTPLGAGGDSGKVPFVDKPSRRAAVAALVENPDVVSGYKSEAHPRRLLDDDGESDPADGLSAAFKSPKLPCDSGESYTHVVISGGPLTNSPAALVKYRRSLGTTSTLVKVEDILASYSRGGDRAATIREFIKDAYANWGTEYVVLAGDTSIIPARSLYCEAGDEIDNLPSDLYYQCLDGDFDADGDGIYGETGDNVDYYAEVKVGRVSAETDAEFSNWLDKVKRYDADVAAGADYTRGALFAAEYLGPYPNIVGKPLMEQIRLGRQYRGANGGFESYGFADVPEFFDGDRMPTLYDTDENESWGAAEISAAIAADGGVSVINHMGHSNSGYNMRFTKEDVDALSNENPFFVYSQGCIAGAFDEDCIAEHFTTSTRSGAFGGVWNSRYGWYSFTAAGVSPAGGSHRLQRRFWDAVFRDEIHELGHANMVSHERNAAAAQGDGYMRWCLYESNLFGDPIQQICGAIGIVEFDREAYRSDATMSITYRTGTLADSFTALVSAFDTSSIVPVATAEVVLPYAGAAGNRFIYQAQFDVSRLGVGHDWTVTVTILEEDARGDSAYIDDIPPAFRNVKLENNDDGELSASWDTYKPDRSNPANRAYVAEETLCEFHYDTAAPFADPQVATTGVYAATHSLSVPDLPYGLYYVRILAADRAGNTNVWNSAEPTAEVVSQDSAEYGEIALTPRQTVAAWNMERDASGWTTDDPSCWQLGVPTYGPENASRCWGTVIDGRHPDGANASLVSPVIALQSSPTIQFRQWRAIEATPPGGSNLADADYGVVEVIATAQDGAADVDGAWFNATKYARAFPDGLIQGSSGGWEDVKIALPSEFSNRRVRVRFRFVSDTYPNNRYPADYPAANTGNPAGWYIDNVRFLDVPNASGAIFEAVASDGVSPVVLKAGEAAEVRLRTFNLLHSAITVANGAAEVAVSASGVPSGSVTIDGGAKVSPSYGTIPACAYGDASGTFSIAVDGSVPAGTPVTLRQTIRTTDGDSLQATVLLRVADPATIAGTVVQPPFAGLPDPNPVQGAIVSVNASDGDYAAVTDASGAFSFEGFASNRVLRVSAAYGLACATAIAAAPVADLEITLPLSEFNLSTNAVSIEAKSDVAELPVADIVISNFFDAAAPDGNQGPSAPLKYEVTGHLDDNGGKLDWLALSNPKGEVAPGESLALGITLFPAKASFSAENSVTLEIASSGWNVGATNVTIKLAVDEDVILRPLGIVGVEADGDGDGILEAGESGTLAFIVGNASAVAADSFNGTVEVTSGDAALVSDIASWKDIMPGAAAACDPALDVAMGTSGVVEFNVSGWVVHGAFSNMVEIAFAWTNLSCNAMGGVVQAENLHPADPVGEANPVELARVSATGADGTTLYSDYTGTNGVYSIPGLVAGGKYWISVSGPLGSDFVAPQSVCVTADGADFEADITGTTYGPGSGNLALTSLAFSDDPADFSDASLTANNDGYIGNGETFAIVPTFANTGSGSLRALRAKLTLPAEFERDQCMEIVAGSDEIETGPSSVLMGGHSVTMQGMTGCFEATVAAGAAAGDMQRFLLEVWEDAELFEPKRWYFDFSVKVNPRYTLSGSVLDADGNPLGGVRIGYALEGSGRTNIVDVSGTDGSWSAMRLAPGGYTVFVASLPAGCVAVPESVDVTVADADVAGIDFTAKPWGVGVGGGSYDSSTGAISLSVAEGQSSAAEFTISADQAGDGDTLEVSIIYDRKASEALNRAELEAMQASARAALAQAVGTDWRSLDPERFSSSEFEFVFTDDSTQEQRDAYLARRGLAVKYRFRTFPGIVATPAEGMAALASATLADAPANFASGDDASILVSAQPAVRMAQALASEYIPDDEFYGEQWALSNSRQTGGSLGVDIGAEQAWSYAQTTGSRDVLVAVTDTGIEYRHPDLQANWSGRGWNYALDNGNVSDQHGHGTHVAGIIGAVGGNGIGVAGVNWKVSLMSQRICAKNLSGQTVWATSADIARSFEDAYLAGARVNNNSWGSPFSSELERKAIEAARDRMLLVCAAGNDAYDLDVQPNYPASYAYQLDNIIVVAATDHDGGIAEFSSYSPKKVHVAAPGVDILSTATSFANGPAAANAGALAGGGNYVLMSGTSMAAPFVAGAAAFLNAVVPDASPNFVKNAILNGVRKDPLLEEYVATSGHLDLAMAVRLLGAQWLRFGAGSAEPIALKTNVTVAAGASASIPLLVNDPAMLKAGRYSAKISISGRSSLEVPVSLEVAPAPIAAIASVELAAEESVDGLCSHGETVTLAITLRNAGSQEFDGLTATLGGASGGTISTPSFDYGYLPGGDTTMPGLFEVTLPDSGDEAAYTLTLAENGVEVAVLPVRVALADGTVLVVSVTDPDGNPVAGADVELVGAGAGRATTDAEGTARLSASVASGGCTLRVFADGFVAASRTLDASAGTASVELGHASIEAAPAALDFHVAEGAALATNAVVTATSGSGAVAAKVVVARRSRVAVFDDADNSAFLVSRLEGMGFAVDYFPSNYIYTVYSYGPSEYAEIVSAPRYTWDDAALLPYDAVVTTISGASGRGRLLAPLEQAAFSKYVERGGIAVFSGATPLSSPDNVELAALAGLSTNACSVVDLPATAALAAADGIGAPFVALAAGDAFPTAPGSYDSSTNGTFISGECLATTGGDGAVAKIYASERSMLGGRAYLWNGNASDWSRDGAALDILASTLYGELIDGNQPDWMQPVAGEIEIADGAGTEIPLVMNSRRSLGAGTHEATVLLVADVDGARCVPLNVSLTVDPPAVRAFTTGSVTNLAGRALQGDGSDGSCILQLVWAGPDGTPEPPEADGSAGGDDVVLAASSDLLSYARFGQGALPDSGAFDVEFNLSADGIGGGDDGIGLFVRAWDSHSIQTAVLYGDSGVSNIAWNAGLPEPIDFGSWCVSNVFADASYDGNGDGIPDAWAAIYRPGIDSHAAPAALGTKASIGEDDHFDTTPHSNGNPVRVFATEKFVFVLEQYSHRIAVHDRATGTNVLYYGATAKDGPASNHHDASSAQPSAAEGAFNMPYGMAFDTISGTGRFAVADSGNGRIQLFEFDPDSGEVAFVAAFGSKSPTPGIEAPAGTFTEPKAVAFIKGGNDGDLLVADSGNFRVARLNVNGPAITWRRTYDFTEQDYITGLCYAKYGREGFWVANAGVGNKRQRISFHYTSNFSPDEPQVSLGGITSTGASTGEFNKPLDVQIWTVGDKARVAATDYNGSRLRVFNPLLDGTGAITGLSAAADIGDYSDKTLEEYERLWHPAGVFPVEGTNLIYVADTGHNQVKWFGLALDADGDGMDDFWEDANGLDSSIDDSMLDADGDKLPNIGEYLAGTDPQNGDTDGDGHRDRWEMENLTDPLDPESAPDAEEPDEEYETVGWPIDSIAVDSGGAPKVTLAWTLPTANLPSAGDDLAFALGVRFSLSDGSDWDVSLVEVPAQPQGGGTASLEIDASQQPFASAKSAFFTLFWTNKVTE